MADSDPNRDQTKTNTHAPWVVGDYPKVEADLDGIKQYAKIIAKEQQDLMSRAGHLTRYLSDMPQNAWDEDVLDEANYVRQLVARNASELNTYLINLGQTLIHIGSAAKTIADAYGDGDALSAADMNAVLFAFGDRNAKRPAGLPKGLGKTYLDEEVEAMMKGPDNPDSALWGDPVTTSYPYGTIQRSTGPNGQVMEIVSTHAPGSNVTTTVTKIYDAKGHVVFTSSERQTTTWDSTTGNAKTVKESVQDGKVTARTETTSHYDKGEVTKETTTNVTVKQKKGGGTEDVVTSTREYTVNSDGSTHTVEQKPGEKDKDGKVQGPETTDVVDIGKPSASKDGSTVPSVRN
jgi:hypothetical protein